MTAEEQALKAYPKRGWKCKDVLSISKCGKRMVRKSAKSNNRLNKKIK